MGKDKRTVNFVQILTDDQGWGDLGCFGHPFIKSPNIDDLAAKGMKFTHAYAPDSVCSPSRASILTGRTPLRNGVYRWIPANHFCHLPKEEITTPQLLRDAGYQTAHFGKWHLGHFEEEKLEENFEKGRFKFGGELVGQPSMKDYGYDYWLATGNVARPNHENPLNFFKNGEHMEKTEGFSGQIVASEFEHWMDESLDANQPFFVTVWLHEPHGPINSAPEYLEQYPEIEDPSLRQYYANITQIDDAVGRIVASLKSHGVFDDTFIVFTSDNGPEGHHEFGTFNTSDSPYDNSRYRGSTGGLRGRKRHTHDGGIRVPFVATWPKCFEEHGVQEGGVCAEPIVGTDLFNTALDAAGVDIPDDRVLDGTSILPLLQKKSFQRPRPIYWRNGFHEFRVALRDGAWKILGNTDLTKFQFFNMEDDPHETMDLQQHHPQLFEKMKRELMDYDQEVIKEGPDWYKRESVDQMQVPEPKW
jgi:arylsulfatase A